MFLLVLYGIGYQLFVGYSELSLDFYADIMKLITAD
jgi:hypothetical protein